MLCDCTALQMYLKKVVRPRGRTGQYQLPQTKPGYRANPLRLFCCESIDKIKAFVFFFHLSFLFYSFIRKRKT